jgi:hypothetical protein
LKPTQPRRYVITGPEFGEREGHILIISKALYGLHSSGARWHDRFADCIRELGFFPCRAELASGGDRTVIYTSTLPCTLIT